MPALIVVSSSVSQRTSPDSISIFETLPSWSTKNKLPPEKAGMKLFRLFSPLNFFSQFSVNSNLSLKSSSSLGSSGSISSDCQKAIEEHELIDNIKISENILFICI